MDPVEFEVTRGLQNTGINRQGSDTEHEVETELETSVHKWVVESVGGWTKEGGFLGRDRE